jgi:hypothetical protein
MQMRSFESELSRMSFAQRSFRSVPFVETQTPGKRSIASAEPLVEEGSPISCRYFIGS